MSRSTAFAIITFAELLLIAGLIGGLAAACRSRLEDELPAKRELVGALRLTDLALWTEARYTRHPSQTDLFSPFQDLPGAFEHFPAGSIVSPPARHMEPPEIVTTP